MVVSYQRIIFGDLNIAFQNEDERKRFITALYLAYRNIKSEETRSLVSQVLSELEKD